MNQVLLFHTLVHDIKDTYIALAFKLQESRRKSLITDMHFTFTEILFNFLIAFIPGISMCILLFRLIHYFTSKALYKDIRENDF